LEHNFTSRNKLFVCVRSYPKIGLAWWHMMWCSRTIPQALSHNSNDMKVVG